MNNNKIEQLIKIFSKMPSLGPRSARRLVLHLLNNKDNILMPLVQDLSHIAEVITECNICSNLTEITPCEICINEKRDHKTICVLEEVADLWSMEKAGVYKGVYQVLGGNLSALEGRNPEDLNIESLVNRVKNGDIKEIILATNATVNGQTTALYIIDRLKEFGLKISRLAHGLPMGGELEYLDEGTLAAALAARSSCEDA